MTEFDEAGPAADAQCAEQVRPLGGQVLDFIGARQ
jgi:hypothetical protein